MESFNPKNVFEATNRQLSVEELRNKIAVLEEKLRRSEENIEVPDLLGGETDFSDSLSTYEESAKIRVEISDLYEILAEKEGIKKVA